MSTYPTFDPFKDPKHDPLNPVRYIMNDTLTSVAVALVLAVALAQTFWVVRYRTLWMLSMTMGCYTFAVGLSLRFGMSRHPESRSIYTAEYLFVVLSPCAFIASEYVLLGRLAMYLKAERHLLLSPRRITTIFVASDATTFIIQAIGGSMSGSATLTYRKMFLAGLALQLASFLVFTAIYSVFFAGLYGSPRSAADDANVSPRARWWSRWPTLLVAMSISYVGIIVRSVYRVVEISQGYYGPLATTESFFYTLDTLPLFVAIAVYVPFWPGRFAGSMGCSLTES
ncbi:RTA1-domain-containing protein [Auricularia subglabra TFB-10046 SS5]|uniref:RTA1-domain-containing protein n=1 Tax=Auricularia subglabra (strain TFB-10046 / SS5) TaxID=717982 RepID=J0WWY5_AURST|nr:RTA1-domain-containing protein [Auricularia subglabra TFB-10046 SS5]